MKSRIFFFFVIGFLSNIEVKAQAPVAYFEVTAPCLAQNTLLIDSSANNPTSWHWVATGGQIQNSTVQQTSITFSSAGIQTISLIVSNNVGSDTLTKTIMVYPSPSVVVTFTPVFAGKGQPVTFTATGATTYTWTWLTYSVSAQTLTVTFTTLGMMAVVLHGQDSLGCIGIDTAYVKVNSIGSILEQPGANDEILVFPNPFNSSLSFKNTWATPSAFKLTDRNGKLIKQDLIETSETEIYGFKNLPVGIYFLQLEIDGKIITKKIVKTD